jgi:hypothetical protein
VGFYR